MLQKRVGKIIYNIGIFLFSFQIFPLPLCVSLSPSFSLVVRYIFGVYACVPLIFLLFRTFIGSSFMREAVFFYFFFPSFLSVNGFYPMAIEAFSISVEMDFIDQFISSKMRKKEKEREYIKFILKFQLKTISILPLEGGCLVMGKLIEVREEEKEKAENENKHR